ncbi:MAG TPA: HEAT repeat domain-containing protein [Planctomycetota bacterium]|nr:HEAT repeat domain-containing protein [Planctomycetota bacterium]
MAALFALLVAPQDLEKQVAELVAQLMSPQPAVQEQAMKKLAVLPGARAALEVRLSKADDLILRARLRDALQECEREEQRRTLTEQLGRATARWYRPLVDRLTSGDPDQVLELIRELLPMYFGDAKREEFRILVCAAIALPGDGDKWDAVRAEGLKRLRHGFSDDASIEAAAQLLKHRTPALRRDALYTLAHLQASSKVGGAAALLSDPDAGVRREAVRALEALRAASEARSIALLLQDTAPEVRSQAAISLARLGAVEFGSRIVSLVTDPDEQTRVAAVRALGALRSRNFAGSVARRLEDASDEVRMEAIEALALMGAADHAGRVAAELSNSSAQVRAKALEALGRLGDSAQTDAVAERIRDSDPRVRAAALMALADLKASGKAQAIASGLEDPEAWVRRSAIQALVRLKASAHSEAVAARLADRDPFVAVAAVRAVADLGLADRAEAVLGYASTDKLTDQFGSQVHLAMGDLIRAEALDAAGRLGKADLAPQVAAYAEDSSPAVRRSAVRALVRLDGVGRVEALLKLLRDPEPSVGFETMMAISAHRAPALASKLEADIELEGRDTFLLQDSIPMLEKKLGVRVRALPEVSGYLRLPLAVASPAPLGSVLHTLVRDSGFQLGIVADEKGGDLLLMRREDAINELSRRLKGE